MSFILSDEQACSASCAEQVVRFFSKPFKFFKFKRRVGKARCETSPELTPNSDLEQSATTSLIDKESSPRNTKSEAYYAKIKKLRKDKVRSVSKQQKTTGTPGLVSCGAMQDLTNKADESWSSKQIRLLSEEDLEYVRQKVAPDGLVHFANFRDFCRNWWEPLLVTVRRLRHEWNSESPRLILGFIDRKSAENLLQNSREGTFLIRFSDTKAGWLAITFTRDRKERTRTQ